jgi:hypothetical protein
LSGACVAPLNPGNDDAVEYDAQGRRLITIAVDLESDARAVNTPVAQMYIDFYEVVFKGPGAANEYYSATANRTAGSRLSLRVPVGTYTGYLNAGGYKGDDDEVVLLAQAAVTPAQDASAPWTFTLAALDLHVMPAAATSATSDPIYVNVGSNGQPIKTTSGGIPYYEPAAGAVVNVVVTTGVTNIAGYGPDNIAVIPRIRKSDTFPVEISITPTPVFDYGTGKLTFSFTAPAADAVGVSNIGFDIEVAAVSAAKRTNGKAPVRWHIRNGLTVDAYDNGKTDASNIGAGLVFAFGGAVPTAEDVEISFVPPANP